MTTKTITTAQIVSCARRVSVLEQSCVQMHARNLHKKKLVQY